jgi:hypothetical protein
MEFSKVVAEKKKLRNDLLHVACHNTFIFINQYIDCFLLGIHPVSLDMGCTALTQRTKKCTTRVRFMP